jgi:acetyltransferase-like isoleucine patch superfamily enzyme
MEVVTSLTSFEDDRGNRIEYSGDDHQGSVKITFRGSNNVVRVGNRPRMSRLDAVFDCDNGTLEIGPGGGALSINVRLGQDSTIRIGSGTTSTDIVGMSATEGTTIAIGDDVMFASQIQVRADDGHPIFDVRTGKRVNVSRDITIGNHVWIGWGAWVLGGSTVGDGSVLGTGAILKGRIPNNVVAAGVPAKVIRKDIAWERPHLSLTKPYYKPDASTLKKSRYWNLTAEPGTAAHPIRRTQNLARRVRRKVKRIFTR